MASTTEQTFQTNAGRRAVSLFAANLDAISLRQPNVAAALRTADNIASDLTWLLGRDGSLTARDVNGRWWGGSSLPLMVGRKLMKTLELAGSVGCFLAPGTAWQIRAALEILGQNQAIIAVMPDIAGAVVALHCDDFSEEIHGGRASFAVGLEWAKHFADLLAATPGLCVPQQYIRTGLLKDDDLSAMTAVSNPILAGEIARRNQFASDIRARWPNRRRNGKVCVVAGSRFEDLWR